MHNEPLGKPAGTVRAYIAMGAGAVWGLYYATAAVILLLTQGTFEAIPEPHPLFDDLLLGAAGSYVGIRTAKTARRALNGGSESSREDRIEEMATAVSEALGRTKPPGVATPKEKTA